MYQDDYKGELGFEDEDWISSNEITLEKKQQISNEISD